jgi:ligand-binding sensor domain-containing protein
MIGRADRCIPSRGPTTAPSGRPPKAQGSIALNGANWTALWNVNKGLANLFVWSVFEDSQQQIWAGTWGGGLFRLEQDRFVAQTNLIATTDPVVALKESPRRHHLDRHRAPGLVRMRAARWWNASRLWRAAAGDVRAIEAGVAGDLWIGTQGSGLGLWRDGKFKTFQTRMACRGISSSRCPANRTARCGSARWTWVCRYQNGNFRTYQHRARLASEHHLSLEDDQMGNLWFNSPIGLFRISKLQELNACCRRQANETRTAGLRQGGRHGHAGGHGRIHALGISGAGWATLVFHRARHRRRGAKSAKSNPVRPPVWIEDVVMDGQSVTISPIQPTQSPNAAQSPRPPAVWSCSNPAAIQMDVQFTGLSFTSPERVQFKYRLEGLDAGWTDAGTRRRVTYPFLPPGNTLPRHRLQQRRVLE